MGTESTEMHARSCGGTETLTCPEVEGLCFDTLWPQLRRGILFSPLLLIPRILHAIINK